MAAKGREAEEVEEAEGGKNRGVGRPTLNGGGHPQRLKLDRSLLIYRCCLVARVVHESYDAGCEQAIDAEPIPASALEPAA